MEYKDFRDAVGIFLAGNADWTVVTQWDEADMEDDIVNENVPEPEEQMPVAVSAENDEIDLEQKQGAFFVFMTISVAKLFTLYREQGWAAVQIELEERTGCEHGRNLNRRHRCEYYESILSEDGRTLFAELRILRADLAREKRVPPYIVFVNRTLYEMCLRLPTTMEELLKVYGVGEKNSREYGDIFLHCIREHVYNNT